MTPGPFGRSGDRVTVFYGGEAWMSTTVSEFSIRLTGAGVPWAEYVTGWRA